MKQSNKFFNAAKTGDVLELTMYDVIGADMFGEGITPQSVSDALKADCTSISVRLNSPGGDAFAGVAIYNLLKSTSKPVNVVIDGLAASAASIIAMAGDTITMNTGSVLMAHEAMSMAFGYASDMRKTADTLDTVTASIADIYVAKTGLPKSEVLDMMNAETWMNADEAVAKGFATSVSKQGSVKNEFNLSAFRNTPESIKMVVKTREVDGENLTASDFIYAGNPDDPSTWALPYKFASDEKTKAHLRDALARFDQDEVIPAAHKDEAYAKLVRVCGEYGIEVSQRGKAKNEVPVIKSAVADTCECDCPQCTAGECDICSSDTCTDPVCDCYNQPSNKAITSLYAHQLEINRRK